MDSRLSAGHLRDIVDVATDRELHNQIKAMASNQQLNLGKNYFQFQALDAEQKLSEFISSVGEIIDICMLPSRITMENEEAIACLQTKVKLTVSMHDKEEQAQIRQFTTCNSHS